MTSRILSASRLHGNVRSQLEAGAETYKNPKDCLSFLTAQKMIKRFLTCDRIITREIVCRKFTEQELAEKLFIGLLELDVFVKSPSKIFYRKTAGRVTLPLIRLYCGTKWAETE